MFTWHVIQNYAPKKTSMLPILGSCKSECVNMKFMAAKIDIRGKLDIVVTG